MKGEYDSNFYCGEVSTAEGSEYQVSVLNKFWKWPQNEVTIIYQKDKIWSCLPAPTVVNVYLGTLRIWVFI